MERITFKAPEVETEPETTFLACRAIVDVDVIAAVIVVDARFATVPPVAIEPLNSLTKTRIAETVADDAIEPSSDLYVCLITVPLAEIAPLSERAKPIVLDGTPLAVIVAARLRHVRLTTVPLAAIEPLNERRKVFSATAVPLVTIDPPRLLAKSLAT